MSEKLERVQSYLDNEMYQKNNGMKGIFKGVKEIYNPVPVSVNNIVQLTKKGFVVTTEKNQLSIWEEFKENNNISFLIRDMVEHNIMTDIFYIELVNTELGEFLNIITEDMVEEVIKDSGKIKYIKFIGENFEEKTYIKEYFNDYKGENKIIETVDNVETLNKPLLKMRVMEVKSTYNIEPLLNKVDRINEYKAFIYNMAKADGDPMLFMKLISQLKDKEKEYMKDKKHSEDETRVLRAMEELAEVKYIELTGTIIPFLQTEITTIKNEISSEYPEADLTNILSNSSQISENTLKAKLLIMVAKVEDLRDMCEGAFNFVFNILTESNLSLEFDEIFPKNMSDEIGLLLSLLSEGLISKKTIMNKIADLGFIPSYEEEKAQIEKEKNEDKDLIDIYQ